MSIREAFLPAGEKILPAIFLPNLYIWIIWVLTVARAVTRAVPASHQLIASQSFIFDKILLPCGIVNNAANPFGILAHQSLYAYGVVLIEYLTRQT